MIANGTKVNGHARDGIFDPVAARLVSLEEQHYQKVKNRDAQSSYAAGESSRMNPVPRGIDPLGTDADYHYSTEFNYFLMVERGRAAVRNHPLVEQGINRLIANLRLGEITLDLNTGNDEINQDHKQWFNEWANDKRRCDHEQRRTLQQMSRQSFFSEVVDGDIAHIPLRTGAIQSIESHHIRTPRGHRPTGEGSSGIVHGAHVRGGRTVGYWITPHTLRYFERITHRRQAKFFPAFDADGNQSLFYLGFTHRFLQHRGISRLSPPRDAMNGFDDLNYANIKSSLRRSIISYLMEDQANQGVNWQPGGGGLPQAGSRYTETDERLTSYTIEQQGEPAQVHKVPPGKKLTGWNANLPAPAFFEHSALLLTMLSVNLDLPLMFLLLDGSLVNFHGGRMTFDQFKLRATDLQNDQIQGFHNPIYEWKTRQRMTPGSVEYDPKFASAVERSGADLGSYIFRRPGWPYIKPLEDARAEQVAITSNLRTEREVLAARGIDLDEFIPTVINDRAKWASTAIEKAMELKERYPDADINVEQFFRELWYGPRSPLVEAATVKDEGDSDQPVEPSAPKKGEVE